MNCTAVVGPSHPYYCPDGTRRVFTKTLLAPTAKRRGVLSESHEE